MGSQEPWGLLHQPTAEPARLRLVADLSDLLKTATFVPTVCLSDKTKAQKSQLTKEVDRPSLVADQKFCANLVAFRRGQELRKFLE